MRYLIAFVVMAFFTITTYSQEVEVGVFAGGANFIGDVGRTNYILPNTPVGGLIAKWNRSSRHALRLTLLYAEIAADDTKSSDTRRQQRGYSFENTIAEASLGLEFNFWDFDLTDPLPQSTPYLYTGITYFRADHVWLKNGRANNLVNEGSNFEFAIPMVMGYKEAVTEHIIGAFEIGARYTLTDNLDGSWPEEYLGRREPSAEFGNRNTNDWYVFTGITFTFTFGRKPCYCF
ncbi:hypothetical protein C8P64_0393 [Christiangramia gaetbulicola]|uniref:DUF6089 domain-containing protein n=1 Tax=Christiangramia gaetbulicola TaxID=703340 RepID=A0A2T6AKR0_9FLAO|nr:DUF6089 family protein [Christiangramia gaetbulicola]PTX44414.1 hypothetical protein C8P64_0393 [Christiangramia gaetbulicola]